MPKVPTSQGIVDFPDDMSPEEITKALADNGYAPEGLLQKAGRVAGEIAGKVGETYKEGRKQALELLAPERDWGPGLVGQAANVADSAKRALLEGSIPQTLGGAAGQAALGGLPVRQGLNMAQRVAGLVGRAGAGAATGAAVDLAAGDAERAPLTAAETGVGGLVGGLVGEGGRALRQNVRQAPQRAADTAAGIAAVENVLPAASGSELWNLVKGKAGQELASRKFQAMASELEEASPGAQRALTKISNAKKNAQAEQKAGTIDLEGPSYRDVADAFEEELTRKITSVPGLQEKHAKAVADYQQFKKATEFLRTSNAFSRGPDAVDLDFRELQGRLGQAPRGKPNSTWQIELERSNNQPLISAIARGDSPAFQDAVYKISVGSAIANVGPVGVRTPIQGVPLPGISVPAGQGVVPPRDPRIDTLLGGILGRMTGQSAGFGDDEQRRRERR